MMRPQEERISENANAIRIAMTTELNSKSEIAAPLERTPWMERNAANALAVAHP